MNILLTNDDGYASEGLRVLRNTLEDKHEITVVAPAMEQSGKSHAITVHTAIHIHQYTKNEYHVHGSPADCVRVALVNILKEAPDIIISGINRGENVGTDIIYSGTAAAARQGTLMGVPSLACSVYDNEEPYHFESLAQFVSKNLERLAQLWDEEHFVNINAPNASLTHARVLITQPCLRKYTDIPHSFVLPTGDTSVFLQGRAEDDFPEPKTLETKTPEPAQRLTDIQAIMQGHISLSPVRVQAQAYIAEKYTRAEFES